jgi:hypothetical protein
MPEFNVRSDSVNVEQIMEQIRARIGEKRGVDYTEQQIRELAAVKLERFLDPRGVRSDLLNEFRRTDPDPNYGFEDDTLFRSTRGLIAFLRRLLRPLLKLFFNPNPLIHVLHMQSQINDRNAGRHQLYYELIHNLVVETTRLGIEVKNLRMRVESLDARVDFNERRARALEGAVMYRPEAEERRDTVRPIAPPPDRAERLDRPVPRPLPTFTPAVQSSQVPVINPPTSPGQNAAPVGETAGQRSKRRRRRRGRRGGAAATAVMGSPGGPLPGSDGSVSDEPGNPVPAHASDSEGDPQGTAESAGSEEQTHRPPADFGHSGSDDEQ